jgi:hypothetical protein
LNRPDIPLTRRFTPQRKHASTELKTQPTRRRKLWELEEKYHCPVIGSCLNLDELKKIARKDGFNGNHFEPYQLHLEAVSLSCSRNTAAEAMHKLLERKYALVIQRFNQAKTDPECDDPVAGMSGARRGCRTDVGGIDP